MQDAQLLRYSRQILLPEIDIAGQEQLLCASVMILGLGGLGSAAGMYLAAAGIGHRVLVDFDLGRCAESAASNCPRDQGYRPTQGRIRGGTPTGAEFRLSNNGDRQSIGQRRVDQNNGRPRRRGGCQRQLPDPFRAESGLLRNVITARFSVAMGFAGQVGVFKPGQADSPCYACLYNDHDVAADTCTESGVIAPLVGIIGSVQALETIKLVTATGVPLLGGCSGSML